VYTGESSVALGIVLEVPSAPVRWDRLVRERNTFAGYYAESVPGVSDLVAGE
jgi:hypothetical protein